eukprot:CAMPEP_0183331034 /NCGR_PEP_ID=MMETSP0164_2-20130417/450_1 /TAXON_ID=221442 /ORGANISM="Coccolithus pelagicus ssp braarudi, Strain PLY182g" /LENGTH=90 /DNA_ID=CAMNT_0025499393 /DNA_START=79 /DNA_END=351 /DNA_ORIENTATION=-
MHACMLQDDSPRHHHLGKRALALPCCVKPVYGQELAQLFGGQEQVQPHEAAACHPTTSRRRAWSFVRLTMRGVSADALAQAAEVLIRSRQ